MPHPIIHRQLTDYASRTIILTHKKYSKKGVVGLSYSEIEQLIGEELSYGVKAFDHYWTQPSVRRIMSKYCFKFGYINTLTGMIFFEVQ